MIFELVTVSSPKDWKTYHDIRRAELFEGRGRMDYDPNRASERGPNKHSLLFKADRRAVGTVRLDFLDRERIAVRMMAITKSEQKKGYGRLLMKNVEEFAKRKNISRLVLNAINTATGFYERIGFHKEKWDDPDVDRPGSDHVQMVKNIV